MHIAGAAGFELYTTPGVYDSSAPALGQDFVDLAAISYAYVAVVDPSVSSPAICLSPIDVLEFPTVGDPYDLTVTVKSCGADPLTITGATTSLSDYSVPASTNGCIGTWAVGQSCTLQVQFAPTISAVETAILTIDANSPFPGGLEIYGTGQVYATMNLSATSLAFGSQLMGTESAPQPITVTNTGNGPLNGLSFAVTSAEASVFPLTSTCGTSLNAGSSCTISVAFGACGHGHRGSRVDGCEYFRLAEPAGQSDWKFIYDAICDLAASKWKRVSYCDRRQHCDLQPGDQLVRGLFRHY